METREAIRSRRSIRRFEEREVPEEFLREILQMGIWALRAGTISPGGL